MASQLQGLQYEGYLAADPEMRYTPSGQAVTNFRIGSTREYTPKGGEKVKETTWLKVTAWGKLGEIINNFCEKGSWVVVDGLLRVGENGSPTVYQRQNGEWAASYEVTADKIRILRGKPFEGESADGTEHSAGEDDMPF